MANMITGEVIFGGVGSGLYGMLLFVVLAVFIAGLMVGRTPEYLGKKIEAREIKLVMVGTLFVPLAVLVATALAVATKYGEPSIFNSGPQGFSETLYAYISQANNNGSAFAGYTGFVQPNGPATSARSASRSPTCSAAWRCCSAASCRSSRRWRSPARCRPSASRRRAGHVPDRHPHLRRPADRDDRDRRGPDLLPRLPARAGRAGPDRPAVLRCDATSSPRLASWSSRCCSGSPTRWSRPAWPRSFPNKSDGSQIERDGRPSARA